MEPKGERYGELMYGEPTDLEPVGGVCGGRNLLLVICACEEDDECCGTDYMLFNDVEND